MRQNSCSAGKNRPLHHRPNQPNDAPLKGDERTRPFSFLGLTTASVHQLHQLLTPDVLIRLGRVEAAISTTEGFEFGGGFELPSATDEDSVGGGCALEVVEKGFFFHAGLSLPFFAKVQRVS